MCLCSTSLIQSCAVFCATLLDLVGLLTGTSEEMQEQVDSTYLHGVTYLGCGSVDMTMGYKGALEVMLDLKREAMSAVPVTLVVPTNSSGNLR